MIHFMDEDPPIPGSSSIAERAGAVLLLLLAAGLAWVGADLLSGGRLTAPVLSKEPCDDC